MREAGCYCILNDDGYTSGYTCNYCVNLLVLLKNAIVDEKNDLVRLNNQLLAERGSCAGTTVEDTLNTVQKG